MLLHTITLTVTLDDAGRPRVYVDHDGDMGIVDLVGYLEVAKLEAYAVNRVGGDA